VKVPPISTARRSLFLMLMGNQPKWEEVMQIRILGTN